MAELAAQRPAKGRVGMWPIVCGLVLIALLAGGVSRAAAHVVLEGILEVMTTLPAPDDEGAGEHVEYWVRRGRERTRLRLPSAAIARGMAPRAHVRLHGRHVVGDDGAVELLVSDARDVETLAVAEAAVATAGTRRTLLILLNFLDNIDMPITPQVLEDGVRLDPRGLRSYYLENSFGALSLESDVAGWYPIPFEASGRCDYAAWADAADAAAEADGVDLGDYDQITYVFPHGFFGPITGCLWSGLAQIGGPRAWTQVFSFVPLDSLWRTIAHEFGHNLGLGHASFMNCGARAIDDYSRCDLEEYGDPFDNMGGQYFLFNAPHKIASGWVVSSRIVSVGSDGVFTLTPLGSDGPGTKVLKIAKPDTDEEYYLSYRVPDGLFDTSFTVLGMGSNEGVSLHVSSEEFGRKTYALAALPDRSLTLLDGTSFVDAENGVTVTQISHDADSVTVAVGFGPPPTPTPISTPVSTPASITDAVVVAPKPVSVTIRAGAVAVAKNVRVKVVHAGGGPGSIRLTVDDGTCPTGTIAGVPDFEAGMPGAQDTVGFGSGEARVATVSLTIAASAFTTANRKAPDRCTLGVLATAFPGAGMDATPANNVAPIELNVTDLNDIARAGGVDAIVASAAPVRVKIRPGVATVRKNVMLRVRRAGAPSGRAAGPYTLAVTLAEDSCPAGAVGLETEGGARTLERLIALTGSGVEPLPISLTIDAAAFQAASRRSPARCTARVELDTAGGAEGNTSNDGTTLVLDVVDSNDF